MSFNQKSYDEGRKAGLDLALRIVKDGGVQALEDEIRFRGRTNINIGVEKKVLDKATEPMKELCCQTIRVALISVLHDEFGFGKVRIRRVINAFDKLTEYLMHGWLHWLDLVDDITKRLDLDIDTSQITRANLGFSYAHPNLEDIYSETDLVDETAWKDLLKRTGYSEMAAEDEEGCFDVIDDSGVPAFRYQGQFEKIGMYDVLCGIEYEQKKRTA